MKRGSSDERYAKVVAGCACRTALAAVKMIETREGLELARESEVRRQGRGVVLADIDRRIEEVRKCESAGVLKSGSVS